MLFVRAALRIARKKGHRILLILFCLSYCQENIVSLRLVGRV